MSFYVYVLQSNKNGFIKTYVGWTKDLNKRLEKHNLGKGAKSTRGRNWKIIYYEILSSKRNAMRREYAIKKNRRFRQTLKMNL